MTDPAVVPLPARLEVRVTAPFRIDSSTRIVGRADAARALSSVIEARTGLRLSWDGDGAPDDQAGGASAGTARTGAARTGGAITLETVDRGAPESYALTVDDSSVLVTGADAAGLFYGVQTLGQLLTTDAGEVTVPAVIVEDAPRFGYRGVMLDVARHFHPVETVQAYIDRASALKFNALHLHLSDDQGWRIHIDSRPRLTELASGTAVGGDSGGFYTKADYREIVGYAASRHMIVVPEIDLPGHTHAVGLAYPEIVEEPAFTERVVAAGGLDADDLPVAGRPYGGISVGFSSLKIHDEATYDFVSDVLGELAATTPGPYLHVGGDEALGTDPADFALFMQRVTALVSGLGKTPIAWHEAGAAARLDPGTVGQYWGFTTPADGADEIARTFAGRGGVILSPADAIYLDMKYEPGARLGLTWANGSTSVERAYSWEPGRLIDGVDDSGILGVEAPMWSETIRTLDDIDEMAFPRIAAAAEAAWSPSPEAADRRTWDSFRRRVGTLGPLWTSLGIRFHPSDEIVWTTS